MQYVISKVEYGTYLRVGEAYRVVATGATSLKVVTDNFTNLWFSKKWFKVEKRGSFKERVK